VVWNNVYTYARTNGRIYKQGDTYADDGVHYGMKFVTAPIGIRGVQGKQKVKLLRLLGEYYSPHTLRVGLRFNHEPGISDFGTWDPETGGVAVEAYGLGYYGGTLFGANLGHQSSGELAIGSTALLTTSATDWPTSGTLRLTEGATTELVTYTRSDAFNFTISATTFAYEKSEVVISDHSGATEENEDYGGSGSPVYQARFNMPRQKCQVVQFVIDTTNTGGAGRAVSIQALQAEIGAKTGTGELAVDRSFSASGGSTT
jgi:hypothetical protein